MDDGVHRARAGRLPEIRLENDTVTFSMVLRIQPSIVATLKLRCEPDGSIYVSARQDDARAG